MAYLLKTEPSVYSFADLQRDGETIWDGVTNPAAVKFLRGMKTGDRLVIYHTGDERTAVGTAKVLSVDATDPKVPLVRIKAGKPVKQPHTLAEIKAHKVFTGSPLIDQGRLSVVPLTDAQWDWLTGI
jgi:predicted RNA-binding protein with PUA-like domain